MTRRQLLSLLCHLSRFLLLFILFSLFEPIVYFLCDCACVHRHVVAFWCSCRNYAAHRSQTSQWLCTWGSWRGHLGWWHLFAERKEKNFWLTLRIINSRPHAAMWRLTSVFSGATSAFSDHWKSFAGPFDSSCVGSAFLIGKNRPSYTWKLPKRVKQENSLTFTTTLTTAQIQGNCLKSYTPSFMRTNRQWCQGKYRGSY